MNKSLQAITTIATIENTDIQVIENGDVYIPIKPICDLLGVSHKTQFERLKKDPILSSVVTLRVTTGSDGKKYEMQTITLKYVFGWLFKINPDRVRPEARDNFINFQKKCYDAIYDHLIGFSDYVKFRQKRIDTKLEEIDIAKRQFNSAKGLLDEKKKELDKWRGFTFEDFKAEKAQLEITFEKGGE